MIYIFHIFTLAFIIFELIWVFSPTRESAKIEKMLNLTKLYKGKELSEYPDEYIQLIKTRGCFALLTMVWILSGLFTFNWVAFLAFFLFESVVIQPISKLTRGTAYYVPIHWVNSIIGLLFGIFVFINQFHLKIDLYQWLMN